MRRVLRSLLTAGLILAAPGWGAAAQDPASQPAGDAARPPASLEEREVRATVLPGTPPQRPPAPPPAAARSGRGDISLNFAGADARDVAQAVLGDVLGLSFVVDPTVEAVVSLQTSRPVARAAVLPLFEDALRNAGLSLVKRGQIYTVTTTAQARGSAPLLGGGDTGYGNETIQLQYVSAEELKKLLDPIVPNAIAQVDAASNSIVVSGNTTQRQSIRDLVRQFDVDWLRGMSFALFVPQRTDSRLIVPELDKLINSPGAPTNGMVRLISMERLNGILAITTQAQYLSSVQRWVEVLDREGESNERRVFVYRVQNGRSADLSRTLVTAFGGAAAPAGGQGGLPPTSTTPLPGQPSPITTFQPTTPTGASAVAPNPQSGASPANAPAGAVSGAVMLQIGGPGAVTISSDETNNAIVVFATPREYAVVEDALRKLDVLPLQVLVEAAITEVTLNDDLRYGTQWFFETGEGKTRLINAGRDTLKPSFPGFSFVYNNGAGIRATLDALAGVTKINVVSSPKLLVLNNQTASLQVGDQVPIVTGNAVGVLTPNAPIVNEVEYRDTGVILRVTPRVNAGGLVLLDIAQEVSDVTRTNTSSIESPTIQQRKFSSTVAVQDGQTIAMGGLIRDSRVDGRSGIPVLSQIPVLGGLFGVHDNSVRRTELLVLLTPRVVRNPAEAQAITDELREKIRTVTPLKRTAPLIR